MWVKEIPPSPALSGVVTHYRVKQMQLPRAMVFPNHAPVFQGLIFNLEELEDLVFKKKGDHSLNAKVYYVGQAVSPSFLYSSSLSLHIIAVNFTPTGLFRLTGIDLHHFTDKIVDAVDIFGPEIIDLYEMLLKVKEPNEGLTLIDTFLAKKIVCSKKQNNAAVLHSMNALHHHAGNLTVRDLQRLSNATPRTLERAFKSEIGMSPKTFQRLIRFNKAKQYMQQQSNPDWWEVVVKFGFYDHSHFISEFQTFAGMTPTAFMQTKYFQAGVV